MFIFICTVVVLNCFAMCVCMRGFCNVWVCVCVCFVMCGFCNVWVCVVCVCGCVWCVCVCVHFLFCLKYITSKNSLELELQVSVRQSCTVQPLSHSYTAAGIFHSIKKYSYTSQGISDVSGSNKY